MDRTLNIQESLEPIKLFFFSEFQTKEFKEHIRFKVKKLSPYQYYHLLDWLLQNVKDDAILPSLDVLFDFSKLNPKKHSSKKRIKVAVLEEPSSGYVLSDRFSKDCYSFFRIDFGTLKFLLDEMVTIDRINRFLIYYRAKDEIRKPQIDFERLLNLMSLEERLCFSAYGFPSGEAISFYGHALNFLKSHVERDFENLGHGIADTLMKEGNIIKKLFIGKNRQELSYAVMDRTILLLPMLVDFEKWKQLAIDTLKNKELFKLLKTKLLSSLEELKELLGVDYFQDVTAKSRSYIIQNKDTGVKTLKSYSPPLIHSFHYFDWLKNLRAKDLSMPVKKESEDPPKNQIIISKQGSQIKLNKAFMDFFNHIKLKVDDEKSRALESFIYRNFSFEYDEKMDFSKRTVNNFGYKRLDFIPATQAKNFTKLLLYLSDKNYLLSNKTQIIRTLDEDIHEKNGKDGFSYSSLIRIPSDEHHLFPDKEIRRRVRSILKIDD